MTLNIPLTPETEAKLRQRAAEAGKDLAEFARDALEEKLTSSDAALLEETPLSGQQRIAELLKWVAAHPPLGRVVDDSRESIYEGRGE